MIAEYEDEARSPLLSAPRQYALTQKHKHLKEMCGITGLEKTPIFMPVVADFYSGMTVTVPLFADEIKGTAEDIREIYSHQQAINQCSEFLASLKNVRVIACENTAEAARMVAQSGDPTKASLSSRLCAELYQLQVLKSAIQNRDNNYTRFICIAKEPKIYSGADRTSIMINIPNRPGTLFRIMSRFNATGVNLVKLESRQIPEREFEYRFYFDIEASVYSDEFLSLMCELHECGEQFRYFGTYAEII
jgi:chorismate mutase/prephenate dehydratase